jgi:hypothetical protein
MILVILAWLLALAFCVWLFVASVRLFLRGFQQVFPRFGPPTTPSVVVPIGAKRPTAAPAGAGYLVPAWTVKLVSDHLRGCPVCRASVETYRHEQGIPAIPLADLLASLEPVTISRMIAVIEAETPAVVTRP